MSFYPNNITDTESQARDKRSFRITLKADDVIEGQVKPGDAKPEGILIKGPFDNNPMSFKMREQGGVDCTVRVLATYDLDYLEAEIDITTGDPRTVYTNAGTSWETVFTQSLVALGKAARIVDWASAGLSKDRAPTALRFLYTTAAPNRKEVRFEVEEGIL